MDWHTVFFLAMYVYSGATAGYVWHEYSSFAGMTGDLLSMPSRVDAQARSWQFAVGVGAIWPLVLPIFMLARHKAREEA